VVGVVRCDREGAGGIIHYQRLPQLHLHERPLIQLQHHRKRSQSAHSFTYRSINLQRLFGERGIAVRYMGEMAASEGHGEAGGVDDVSIVGCGPGTDEVVSVRVGEEPVAPPAGGGAPRVHGEGEPPRHLYRHLPSRNFIKLQLGPFHFLGSARIVGVSCVGLYAQGKWRLPQEGRVNGLVDGTLWMVVGFRLQNPVVCQLHLEVSWRFYKEI
jgi:hypothetical protein